MGDKVRFGKPDSFWVALIFFVVLLLVYGNHFKNDFIFDDFPNIVENENVHLKEWSWDSVKRCIQGRGFDQIDRPLAFLSFGLNHYFSGLRPPAYHAVNGFIHFGTTLLLFWATRILLRSQRQAPLSPSAVNTLAFWSTLLWSLHPLNSASVGLVVQRMNIGSAFFYLAAFLCYVNARRGVRKIIWGGFCLFFWFCALGMKETALTFPLFLLLFEFCFSEPLPRATLKKILFWGLGGLLLLTPLFAIWLSHHPYGTMDVYSVRPFTPWERVLTESRVLFHSLSLFFFPAPSRLMWIPDIELSTGLFRPANTAFCVAFWVLFIPFCLRRLRRWPMFCFPVLFFVLNQGIEASFISLEIYYDYRNYQPGFFVFLPLLWALRHFSEQSRTAPWNTFLLSLFALFLSFQTLQRNAVMKNNFSLWKDNAEKAPGLWVCQYSLAGEYYSRKQYGPALHCLEKALGLKSNELAVHRAHTLFLKGLCLRDTGRVEEALACFEEASRQQKFPELMYQYGSTEAALKQWGPAEIKLRAATRNAQTKPTYFYTYVVILTKNGKWEEARKELGLARRRWPDNLALKRLQGSLASISHRKQDLRSDERSCE